MPVDGEATIILDTGQIEEVFEKYFPQSGNKDTFSPKSIGSVYGGHVSYGY